MVRLGAWMAAAACAAAGVSGASLREVMQQRLEATGTSRADTEMLLTGGCRTEDPSTDSRTCEPSTANKGFARCNDCSQRCHVWGDPHLEDFRTSGTRSVFAEPGEYFFYATWYKNWGAIIQVASTMLKTSDMGTKPFVTKAWINTNSTDPSTRVLLMDASTCTKSSSIVNNIVSVPSDRSIQKNPNKPALDVDVNYIVKCRKKHGVWSLEVMVDVMDENLPVSPSLNKLDTIPYNESTLFIWDDFGACVNPYDFGTIPNLAFPNQNALPASVQENLDMSVATHRTSDWANKEGHVCSCSMECAVWGDPHVNSYWQKSSRSAEDSMVMPKTTKGLTNQESFLYQWKNQVAVMVEMDSCEFVVNVIIYVMKQSALDTLQGCSQKSMTTDWLDADSYDVFEYRAEDMCTVENSGSKTRAMFEWPSGESEEMGSEYLDDDLSAYNLGSAAWTSTNQIIPQKSDTKSSKMQSCVKSLKQGELVTNVDLGGFKVISKCHKLTGTKNNAFRPYFNVCIERFGTQPFNADDEQEPISDGSQFMQSLESASLNSGWCTTEDFKKGGRNTQVGIAASSFVKRPVPGTALPFVLSSTSPVK